MFESAPAGYLRSVDCFADEVVRTAAATRLSARAAAAAARATRMRSRLLRGQAAALHAKMSAGAGRAPTRHAHEAALAEVLASTEALENLATAAVASRCAARAAHRRILERYAALGPSLPN